MSSSSYFLNQNVFSWRAPKRFWSWLRFLRKNVGYTLNNLSYSTFEWKYMWQLKSVNHLLSRERKGEMKSLSHMTINIPLSQFFPFPHLIFNFLVFRRSNKLLQNSIFSKDTHQLWTISFSSNLEKTLPLAATIKAPILVGNQSYVSKP